MPEKMVVRQPLIVIMDMVSMLLPDIVILLTVRSMATVKVLGFLMDKIKK